jgi:uncharacterized protein (TIGR03437 family)
VSKEQGEFVRIAVVYVVAGLLSFSGAAQQLPPCTIETFAGGDTILGEGKFATEAELLQPNDARRAPDGSLWVADSAQDVIRRIGPDGVLRTLVGTGADGFSGDGGPATAANISRPASLLFAADGTLYFHDAGDSRIRRVNPEGIIATVVGGGGDEWAGEDAPASAVTAAGTVGLAFSPAGELVFAVSNDHRVRRLTSDGHVVTIAGTSTPGLSRGGFSGDGGPAIEAALSNPRDVAVAEDGTMYIADQNGERIRRIAPGGIISTYLGLGEASSDGTPAEQATVARAPQVALDAEGRLYWRDARAVRRISSEGLVETLAPLSLSGGFFSVEADGTLYVIDHEMVSVWTGSELVALAGIGPGAPRGDGGPATAARVIAPYGLAVGPAGEVYISDQVLHRIRVVGTDGIIRNFAGTGEQSTDALEGLASETPLSIVTDIASDGRGNVYVGDLGGRLARIDSDGFLTTVVPPSTECSDTCGDGGPAKEARTPLIRQVAADGAGNVYVLHRRPNIGPSNWIRRIAPDGTIGTLSPILSDGTQPDRVSGIAIGTGDHLLVSTQQGSNYRIWRYHPETAWSKLELADGYLYPTESLAQTGEDLFAVDASNRVRRMTADGTVATVAGTTAAGFTGDGGPATAALLSSIRDIALDQEGNLFIADLNNGRVRRVNRILDCTVPSAPTVAINGTRHGASYGFRLAPGTIFSVFGRRLGPIDLAAAQLEGDRFPTELAGVSAFIDGIPAPLIFVFSGQLSGIVPYGIEVDLEWSEAAQEFFPSQPSFLEIDNAGARSEPYRFLAYDAAPGLFSIDSTGTGQGAILNQDGSLNSEQNAAAPGSIVVFYATGDGLTDPPGEDGKIAGSILPRPLLPVRVKIGGIESDVLYAGAAPGLTAGVIQVNARIPPGLTQRGPVGIELIVGSRSSGAAVSVIVGE